MDNWLAPGILLTLIVQLVGAARWAGVTLARLEAMDRRVGEMAVAVDRRLSDMSGDLRDVRTELKNHLIEYSAFKGAQARKDRQHDGGEA